MKAQKLSLKILEYKIRLDKRIDRYFCQKAMK